MQLDGRGRRKDRPVGLKWRSSVWFITLGIRPPVAVNFLPLNYFGFSVVVGFGIILSFVSWLYYPTLRNARRYDRLDGLFCHNTCCTLSIGALRL